MSVETRIISESCPGGAGTAVGSTLDRLDHFDQAQIVAILTGPTGGTLDVYLQMFDGTDWIDYLHFAQVAATVTAIRIIPITRTSQRTATVTVGRNGTPALALDTCIGGDFGDKLRAVYVAGAGTTVAAAQIIRLVGTKITR